MVCGIGISGNVGSTEQLTVPLGKLREAITIADPDKPRLAVSQLLARGLGNGVSVEMVLVKEATQMAVSVESFKSKLKGGMLKRSPPEKNYQKHERLY